MTTARRGRCAAICGSTLSIRRLGGWSELGNGELLDEAEREAYDVLITSDQNLPYQQNVAGRGLAIVVLRSGRWPRIRRRVEEIREALGEIRTGEVREVES